MKVEYIGWCFDSDNSIVDVDVYMNEKDARNEAEYYIKVELPPTTYKGKGKCVGEVPFNKDA